MFPRGVEVAVGPIVSKRKEDGLFSFHVLLTGLP